MTNLAAPAVDELLRHEDFVRQTLRGLLRDESQVDDAVQETWLRAMGKRIERSEPKLWLARIARNLAVSRWRGEQRRACREQAIEQARERSAEAVDVSVRRLEMRQRVAAEVLSLEEPYRSVVLLRYEQGLAVAEIGAKLGRSAATVRSQLSRAHEQLRQRFDRDFGGRERWSLLAAPLLDKQVAAVAPALPIWATCAAGTLLAAAAVWLGWNQLSVEVAPVAGSAAAAVVLDDPSAAADPEGAPAEAAAVATMVTERREVVQDPRQRPVKERLLPAATLLDQGHYSDYERATFSFEHGLRDDPDGTVARNDWCVAFAADQFRVNTVVDDRSTIVDLGRIAPEQFGRIGECRITEGEQVVAKEGHAYFIHTVDSETDLATVVFVRKLESQRSCAFDWYTTDGTDRAQGSLRDPRNGRSWASILVEMRGKRFRGKPLARPRVHLQLRCGANGGNPVRVCLNGTTSRVDHESDVPLDMQAPPKMVERPNSYSDGGSIPSGKQFVVTRIDYAGRNPGDGNGSGNFRIVMNGRPVVDIEPSQQPIHGKWVGSMALSPGMERATWFELSNSSYGEARIYGEFVDVVPAEQGKTGFPAANRGFFVSVPAKPKKPQRLLGVPTARMQVKAVHVGGNPCRIDLRGRKNGYIRELADQPIDLSAKLENGAVGYFEGGRLPPGTVFVVTRVTWSAMVGDRQHSNVRVVVAGQTLLHSQAAGEAFDGEWTGELEIAANEESRTYLEVSFYSHADVRLTGHFVTR